MNNYHRLNHKLAEWLCVRGGYEDKIYNYSYGRIYQNIEDRYNKRLHNYYCHYGSPQRWRDAQPFHKALSILVKNYHVPIWFMK